MLILIVIRRLLTVCYRGQSNCRKYAICQSTIKNDARINRLQISYLKMGNVSIRLVLEHLQFYAYSSTYPPSLSFSTIFAICRIVSGVYPPKSLSHHNGTTNRSHSNKPLQSISWQISIAAETFLKDFTK